MSDLIPLKPETDEQRESHTVLAEFHLKSLGLHDQAYELRGVLLDSALMGPGKVLIGNGKPTIAELEKAFDDHEGDIDIAPDGSVSVGITEKDRRIYYQDIVYSVCRQIDRALGVKTVCGTVAEPSDEVQDSMEIMVDALLELRRELPMLDPKVPPSDEEST